MNFELHIVDDCVLGVREDVDGVSNVVWVIG